MALIEFQALSRMDFSRCRAGISRAVSFCATIRGQIVVAFLIMSIITIALGGYATLSIRDAGVLVHKTYDESLMSINYARAAATDFTAMRAAFARRWIATDPAMRTKLDNDIVKLSKGLAEDIEVALQRSQSARAKQAAIRVQVAATAWMQMSEQLIADSSSVDWDQLDQFARKVDQEFDLLVNYTAGDGFLYRQTARATVARDMQFNLAGTVIAIILLTLVAWTLARRIVGPVAAASNVAELIASGKLDAAIPKGSNDELGDLLESMGLMRDNIRSAMEREVAQRRSAQMRLADALQSSQEGIVVVDADNRIALANVQAADFLGLPADVLRPGTPLGDLDATAENPTDAGRVLMQRDRHASATIETLSSTVGSEAWNSRDLKSRPH